MIVLLYRWYLNLNINPRGIVPLGFYFCKKDYFSIIYNISVDIGKSISIRTYKYIKLMLIWILYMDLCSKT